MNPRRNSLQVIKAADLRDKSAHAGLWLDKFYGEPDTKTADLKRQLVEDAAKMTRQPLPSQPSLYKPFFDRWRYELEHQVKAKCWDASVRGRVIIGLGSESVWENSISLHRTYGVPFIPGSALKGLAASFARNRLADWTDAHSDIAFGKTDDAGYVTFYDALYVPNSGHEHPKDHVRQALYPDVITVHHPKYYQEGTQPPADWDDPRPIPFMSATGKYLIALAGPDKWVNVTFAILKIALNEVGVGAKTSSGYGRLSLL